MSIKREKYHDITSIPNEENKSKCPISKLCRPQTVRFISFSCWSEFCSHVLWGLKNLAIVCKSLGNISPNAAVNVQKPAVSQTRMAQSCWRFYSFISVSESLLELHFPVSKPCRSTPHESGILEEFLCVQMFLFLFHCVIILLTKSQVWGKKIKCSSSSFSFLGFFISFDWVLNCTTQTTHTHTHTHSQQRRSWVL